MILSLNILYDLLDRHHLSFVPHGDFPKDISFSRVCLLPGDTAELNSEYLYVASLTDALHSDIKDENITLLCLRDRLEDFRENPDVMKGKIVVSANITLTFLFNLVNDRFLAISEWISAMQSAIINNAEIKDILALCSDILPNSINITDSSMRMIACTDTETDDEITLRLRKYGYHPEETMVEFRKNGSFKVWVETPKVFITDRAEIGRYQMVNKVLKFKDAYFFHIVMVCDHQAPTPATLDLFNILLDTIQGYIYRQRDYMLRSGNRSEILLLDLLSGNISRENDIVERARFADIPFSANYVVNVIGVKSQYLVSLSWLRNEIAQLFPEAYTVIYSQRVFLLSTLDYFHEDEKKMEQLRDTLTKYDAVCAESIPFQELSHVLTAYQQSILVLKHAGVFRSVSSDSADPDPRFFRFQDLSMYLYVLESSSDLSSWDDSPCITAVRNLISQDAQKGTDNARTLYLFLLHERNGTVVGKIIHMHRNNVAYRIAKICESQNIDLEDPSVRFGLLLAFIVLKPFSPVDSNLLNN